MTTIDMREGSGKLQEEILRQFIGTTEDKSFIDLCCGEMTITRNLKFRESVHVDVIDEPARPRQAHFVLSDVLGDHPVLKTRYGVAFCGDGIEHLTKANGYKLAHQMTLMAPISIIFTPLGELWMRPESKDPKDHHSGWNMGDLPGWEEMVFPNWHPTLNCGAIFYVSKA